MSHIGKTLVFVLSSFIVINFLIYSFFPSQTLAQTQINLDFSSSSISGSPLIFGGNWGPNHQSVWQEQADLGVTFLRQDWWLNDTLPSTTIDDYKNNVGNIQDPQNWDTNHLEWLATKYKTAKSHNMKIMAIVDYAPSWLTYSGTDWGVPRDWDVWESIVRNMLLYFQENHNIEFDYIEVWNEPNVDNFLHLDGSGMSRVEAYQQIYLHTWNAIRSVDEDVLIGGPVASNPATGADMLDAMLDNSQLKDKIDFVSVHEYDLHTRKWFGNNDPDYYLKQVFSAHNKTLPIFLTEFNKTCCGTDGRTDTAVEISYVGKKFIWMLKSGIEGAHYFSLSSQCTPHGECFYDWSGSSAVFKPPASVWRLMSKNLGLGKGESNVFQTPDSVPDTFSLGAINFDGNYIFVLSNDSSSPKTYNINLNKLPFTGSVKVIKYIASADNNASEPVSQSNISLQSNSLILNAQEISANSVLGLVIEGEIDPSPPPSQNPILGDANGDGKVDGKDYLIWLDNYGAILSGANNGDFDGNGNVSGADFMLWVDNYTG